MITEAVLSVAARAIFVALSALVAMELVRRTSLSAAPRGVPRISAVFASGVTAWLIGPALLTPPAVVLLPLAVVGTAAAVVDAQEGRLPDPLTLALVLGTLAASSVTRSDPIRVLGVAAASAALALLVKSWSGAAIGWGDVKLAPTLGIVLDHFDAVIVGVRNIALLVLGTAIVLTVGRRSKVVDLVPYGPALVFGTVGAVFGR
ncbi:prepilin peptidase [Pseudonocardia sp. GCM10023141]|uniref:prepilin peptidase n=1 Tax=Pseudonocardia sp. GCM10023141 TaxID=3252653 RepID=UPI00360D8881